MATGTTETGHGMDVTGRPTALRSIDLDTFFRPQRVAVVGASDSNARPNTALTQKITVWAEERGATVYFVTPQQRAAARRSLGIADIGETFDVLTTVRGGGIMGQADAVKAAYAPGFDMLQVLTQDEWCCIHARRGT